MALYLPNRLWCSTGLYVTNRQYRQRRLLDSAYGAEGTAPRHARNGAPRHASPYPERSEVPLQRSMRVLRAARRVPARARRRMRAFTAQPRGYRSLYVR